MYLHLGEETVILNSQVIGIFDIETTTIGRDSRQFLKQAERELRLTTVGQELPKSFVLCSDTTGQRVYLSQISSKTLKSRAKFLTTATQEIILMDKEQEA